MSTESEIERLTTKINTHRAERLNDAGDLVVLAPDDVTLAQFNYHGSALRRLDPIKYTVIQRNLLINFVKTQMVKGRDYGLIPGCGDKLALYKVGAERLATLFNYSIKVECTSKKEEYDGNGLFSYTYKATVIARDGTFVECEANCNSKEKKYAFRNVKEAFASEEEKQKAVGRKKNSKNYWDLILPNEDIFSIVNTIMKMSEKRAIVGAVILACNATGFFENAETAVENEIPENRPKWDGETIDAEYTEAPSVPQPAKPSQRKIVARICAVAKEAGFTPEARDAMLAEGGYASKNDIPATHVDAITGWFTAETAIMWNAQVTEPAPSLD